MNARILQFIGVFVLSLFSVATQAEGWACTHGQTANIEYIDRVETLDRVHIGWGLDFDQKPGLYNWIHISPPSVHGAFARYVALQFWLGSIDADVNKVHVYNLGEKIKSFDDLPGYSQGWHTEVFDLGSDLPISAVNLAVEIGAGVESMSHQFVFTGACVYLKP